MQDCAKYEKQSCMRNCSPQDNANRNEQGPLRGGRRPMRCRSSQFPRLVSVRPEGEIFFQQSSTSYRAPFAEWVHTAASTLSDSQESSAR